MKYILIFSLGFVMPMAVLAQGFQLQSVETEGDGKVDAGVTILETIDADGVSVESTTRVEVNSGTRTTGIEHEDIGVTGSAEGTQHNETNLEFINERADETSDKDHKGEIDVLSTSPLEATSGFLKVGDIKGESNDSAMRPEDEIMILLRPASSDDTEGATTTSRMNKADLIESLHATDVFIKIGDIKGESTDDDTAAKKPKEIVVVGSKARDEATPVIFQSLTNNESTAALDSFFDIFVDVQTDEDVQLHALSLAQRDENIEQIELKDEEISVDYTTTIRLFGFIPVATTQRTTVAFGDGEQGASDADSLGRVKVQLPWWHIFGRKTVRPHDFVTAYEEAQEADIPAENVTLNFAQVKAQTVQTISNMMKARHDAAMSTIQNVR